MFSLFSYPMKRDSAYLLSGKHSIRQNPRMQNKSKGSPGYGGSGGRGPKPTVPLSSHPHRGSTK